MHCIINFLCELIRLCLDMASIGAQAGRSPRVSKLFVAWMWTDRIYRHQVLIRNISPDGVRIRSKLHKPEVGETIRLELADQKVCEGLVRWVKGNEVGAQLTTPVDPDNYRFDHKEWSEVQARYDQQRFNPPIF